jgi:hypothetical protein
MHNNLMCLPRGHELQKRECNLPDLLHSINLFLLRMSQMIMLQNMHDFSNHFT